MSSAPAGPHGIDVLGIDHVGIAVPDLAEAIDFYERVFGLRCVHRETNVEQGVHEAVLGPDSGPAQVQLLAPLGPDSPVAAALKRPGPRMHHIAYTVKDVDAASAQLRAQGLRMLF